MILCAIAAGLAIQTCVPEARREELVELPLAPMRRDEPLEQPISLIVSDYEGRPEVWLLASRRLSRDVALDAYLLAAPDERATDLALGVSLRFSFGGPRPSSRR